MATVNYVNPKIDASVKIFDAFYNYTADVPSQEYDAVYSYFRSVFGTKVAAGNMTVTLCRVSEASQIPVMDLLAQMQGRTGPEITITMAYYLNNLRSPSTLLGITSPVTPNFYASRNVKA